MIDISFPDGSKRQFERGISGFDIAASISKSLEKKAIAIKVDGVQLDLTHKIESPAAIEIITADSAEGLEIIRHDAAHILAQAVKELYPDWQLTIGPAIENGFYYDFVAPSPITEQDLPKIEARMKEIVERNLEFKRQVMSRSEAIAYFKKIGENYKMQLIENIPEGEEVSLYSQGDFIDLCRGPHAVSTGRIRAFKLLRVSGAYWRGDSNNEMLQRIYGTAWGTQQELDAYLTQLEEAEKRDHRRVGREMGLFHFQDEAPGAVFWHPKGWQIFQTLVAYMKRRQKIANYQEINTPEVMDKCLWEQSGHWEKFGQNMFTAESGDEKKIYAIKPMSCPGGVQVYKRELRSYRDLPLRLSEFGKVHRYEPSGALHGLMRVRAFTQDDAHIFCTPEQLMDECKKICEQILLVYKDFGFNEIHIKFSDRPEKRIGSDEVWDKAEAALQNAAESAGLKCTLNAGEGAFYGPKLEFALRDAIGRDWQIGTLQVDLNLPERLGAYYIGEDGQKHHAVMLHQAIFGSLERFIGILIEHYAGKLPLWLAPTQVVIATITNEVDEYARFIYNELKSRDIRVELDLNNEKINYKIRKHSLLKVPTILVVGREEASNQSVAVRKFGETTQENLEISEFISKFTNEIKPPF
ncbi:MAG: thrS [Candidatus Midichloriaceae bacterium]|jgi:threonyl-tRNA synthetase|nr:thrS [Candidatus Midichloriaceae bacterium]